MYDFCPYCGKQLENGETCPTCRPREYNTYGAPQNSNQDSGAYNRNYEYNTNYNQGYNTDYEAERRRYDSEFSARTNKKNVIIMSVFSLSMSCEAIFCFWSGLVSAIFGVVALVLAISAQGKNKKLENPLIVGKVALVISIIGLVIGVISSIAFLILMFGDGYTIIFEN